MEEIRFEPIYKGKVGCLPKKRSKKFRKMDFLQIATTVICTSIVTMSMTMWIVLYFAIFR